jgi:hypothetical protein
VYQTIEVINVSREYISCPLIFTILACDVKLFNSVTIDRGLVSINDRIVTIDPNSLLVMRNGK